MTQTTVDNTRHVGRAIRDRRERLGRRQWEVATEAEISRQYYSDLETGRHRASRLVYLRIARALDMPTDDMDRLLGGAA